MSDSSNDFPNASNDLINSFDFSDPFTGAHSICEKVARKFSLRLTSDFKNRPIYVCPDGHIFLETFSPFYKPAYEFIISIAEAISRPKYIHEYQISTYSLHTAVSLGLNADEIIRMLTILSKCEVHQNLIDKIKKTIQAAGKLKLILKNRRYFVQSSEMSLLEMIANKLDDYRIKTKRDDEVYDEETGFIIPNIEEEMKQGTNQMEGFLSSLDELGLDIDLEDNAIDEIRMNQEENVRRFEINEESVSKVRQIALSMNIPFSDEYDFRSDGYNKELPINLRKEVIVRAYQEKALSKMFSGSRAKSGIIVLPCGAGKTLVGIIAACTIRKSTIIFCDTNLSIQQWYDQLLKYSTLEPSKIFIFNSENKITIPGNDSCIVLTTYSIFASGKSSKTIATRDNICKREWGLMIADEVQTMVANTFKRATDLVKAHSKLGLTATLVREDNKILDLNYLIGPRLYEANWIDLSDQGFIAKVKCYEIWCKMPGEFYREYLHAENASRKRILSSVNPNKFKTVERLIKYHESRGDKILVFADIIYVLNLYGSKLSKCENRFRPVLQGSTPLDERAKILAAFKTTNKINCIFISSIGDKALDLPDANVLIQICSHFGARMQEAQRLGRILRKKPGTIDDYNSFFYTIVSEDTREMFFSRKRQQFLTNQGYIFEVVDKDIETRWPIRGKFLYENEPNFEKKLLNECLGVESNQGEIEEVEENEVILPKQVLSSSSLTGEEAGLNFANL